MHTSKNTDQEGKNLGNTYLVDHVSDQAFHFIRLDFFALPKLDCCREFFNFDSCPSVPRVVTASGEEDFSHQVSQTNVSPPFEREIDAPFDELRLPGSKGAVEVAEGARADGCREGLEQGRQAWVWC